MDKKRIQEMRQMVANLRADVGQIAAELCDAVDGYLDAAQQAESQNDVLSLSEIQTLRRLIECAEELDKRPRPMCRDCADENGACPNSGLECDMRKLFDDAKTLHNKLAALMWGPRDGIAAVPTDPLYLPGVLRQFAGDNGYSHNDYADVMRQAADEIERAAPVSGQGASIPAAGEPQGDPLRDIVRSVRNRYDFNAKPNLSEYVLAGYRFAASMQSPTAEKAGGLTLQQVADRINGRGVMSPVEFRRFLNGDGVEMYPHQIAALVNLFPDSPTANGADDQDSLMNDYRHGVPA